MPDERKFTFTIFCSYFAFIVSAILCIYSIFILGWKQKKKNTLRLNVFCKNIFFGKITTFLFKHPVVLKKNSMDWWWKVTTKSLGCQQSNVSHQYFQMVLKSNWNSELFTGLFCLLCFRKNTIYSNLELYFGTVWV